MNWLVISVASYDDGSSFRGYVSAYAESTCLTFKPHPNNKQWNIIDSVTPVDPTRALLLMPVIAPHTFTVSVSHRLSSWSAEEFQIMMILRKWSSFPQINGKCEQLLFQ
jgi:hypothetical protein